MNKYENENVGEGFDLFNDFTHEILGTNSIPFTRHLFE